MGRRRTKPKALDYALPLARGKYLVVYDAEDVPEPGQLREAASRFEADPGLACLQAELVPENGQRERADGAVCRRICRVVRAAVAGTGALGTADAAGRHEHHFRTSVLRDLGGWDAFNVTEDADLGVRLARRGLRAETFESRTYEEAPLTLSAWIAQRTRWMKGWMQTFVVHIARRDSASAMWAGRAFSGFQVLVGGMILAALLHTIFIGALLQRLVLDGAVELLPADVSGLGKPRDPDLRLWWCGGDPD